MGNVLRVIPYPNLCDLPVASVASAFLSAECIGSHQTRAVPKADQDLPALSWYVFVLLTVIAPRLLQPDLRNLNGRSIR